MHFTSIIRFYILMDLTSSATKIKRSYKGTPFREDTEYHCIHHQALQ